MTAFIAFMVAFIFANILAYLLKGSRDDSSKTRLSILFYAISGNCVMMAKQNVKLLNIFNESFKLNQKCS